MSRASTPRKRGGGRRLVVGPVTRRSRSGTKTAAVRAAGHASGRGRVQRKGTIAARETDPVGDIGVLTFSEPEPGLQPFPGFRRHIRNLDSCALGAPGPGTQEGSRYA